MTTELTTNINLNLAFIYKKLVGGQKGEFKPTFTDVRTLATGTAKNQNDVLWFDGAVSSAPRIIAAGATQSLDLLGALSNAFGDTLNMVKLVGLIIRNYSTGAADILRVGGNANAVPIFNDATDKHDIGPDGLLLMNNPSLAGLCTITGGTADILDLQNTNGADAINIGIAAWGRTA